MAMKDEPWLPPLPKDGQYWMVFSEIEALALAEGIVLARTQQQARHVTSYLETTEAVEQPKAKTA